MALPTGTIAMSDVNGEIGKAATAQTSLDEQIVRTTAATAAGLQVLPASSTISLNDLRGAQGTQVFNNMVGGVYYISSGPGQVTPLYGTHTIGTSPTTATFGSWPSGTLQLSGSGMVACNLICCNLISGAALDLINTFGYAGDYNIWWSADPSTTWPNSYLGIFSYQQTVSYSGGTAYRWFSNGTIVDISTIQSCRIAKA